MVLSANVHGLRTNIGDLINSFALQHSADIAVTTETELNDGVEPNLSKDQRLHPVGQKGQAWISW